MVVPSARSALTVTSSDPVCADDTLHSVRPEGMPMRVADLLSWITQGTLLLIAVLTLIELGRYRDRARIDIALMFGALAAIVLLQGLSTVLRQQAPWLVQLGAILLLAQPYLLLRLVQHFRHVVRTVQWIAGGGMLASWIVLIVFSAPLPPSLTLLIIAYFVYVEGYTAVAFVGGAIRTGGVTRQRLLLAATGSSLLALVILLAGISQVLPIDTMITAPLSQFFGLLCIVSYYLGFAPPRWLRRVWELSEVERYLRTTMGYAARERVTTTLNQLCLTSMRSTGGLAAAVALWDKSSEQLVLRASSHSSMLVGRLMAHDGAIGRAWHARLPTMAHTAAEFGTDVAPLAAAAGAGALLVVPIGTAAYTWGLLIVFLTRVPLFARDDLNLLALLAAQSAIALDCASLLEEQQELVVQLRQRTTQLTASNQALELASQTKDRFLATMSHELRTPLNAIIGFTGTLLMKLPGPLTTGQEKQLQTIQTSSRHLLSLINDLLDLVKIESGKVELNLEPVVCQSVVEEIASSLRPLAERKGVQFTVVTPAEPIVVQSDRRALSQILLNLTGNAIKFTEQGEVCIVLACAQADGRRLTEITVTDTGIGIRAEDQARLFQAFEQGAASGARRQEGTGLGLHLSQKLAQLLGGRIAFESEDGKGSSFTLMLTER
jgi:signal transduction histidine kinase